MARMDLDPATDDLFDRARDGQSFRWVLIGALACGSSAATFMHLTMGWLPNSGPMLGFCAFAGAVLGAFAGSLAGSVWARRAAERADARREEAAFDALQTSSVDVQPEPVAAIAQRARREFDAVPESGRRPIGLANPRPSWQRLPSEPRKRRDAKAA